MYWLILYDRGTLQIEAFVSNSFKEPILPDLGDYDANKLANAELVDPAFEITRDKRVVLEGSKVIGTIDSQNPIQPSFVPPRNLPAEVDSLKAKVEELEAKLR